MNDLTPTSGGPPGLHTPRQSTGRTASRILQAAEHMQEPWLLVAALTADFPEWSRAAYREAPTLAQLRHPDRGEGHRQRAEEILAALAPKARLQEVYRAFLRLDEAKPDRAQTLALISAMVDGFPNARPHSPEAYLEGMLHEVMVVGHTPPAVARATREIVRSDAKFPPTIGELLRACEQAAEISRWSERIVDVMALQSRLEQDIVEADRLGPRDIAAEWRERIKTFADTGVWAFRGPKPGERWCECPAEILAEFGYSETPEERGADGAAKIRW